jgi:methoxymalonate biosynthesis protein
MSGNTTVVKCLVWDLDNTLWQGVLSEGDEVQVSAEVREVIAVIDGRGILQSVSSKNDADIAWQRLTELGLAEYFVLPQISWGRKSDAVRAIGDQLRFALDTIAFIDDQPAERAEVAYHLPEVRCYPAESRLLLTGLPEFSPATFTVDSRRRRQMYQASFHRDAQRAEFPGPDEDFLRSLDLVMEIGHATEESLSRVEELTLRTSQMNATGVHYSGDELSALCADPHHDVLTVVMSDRFGPYGAVGVALLERTPSVWHLKLLATSCRVLSLGAGANLINWLASQAARAGVHLIADYRPTKRNRMMDVAYRFAGFDDEPCECRVALTEPALPEIQRLHLSPVARRTPDFVQLIAPAL